MMNPGSLKQKQTLVVNIDAAAGLIAQTQKNDGEIPWTHGDKTDPWDHVESIMGLTIGGFYEEARKAFYWLKNNQIEDGCWYAVYRNGTVEDPTHDTNMASYMAVGLLHYYLVTGDKPFLEKMWQTMAAGIEFAIGLQQPEGEIYWAKSPKGVTERMALLTGSSSVYMSLKCALVIAALLEKPKPVWKVALYNLKDAICNKPHLFNMTKSRFSMDWFYPILSGAVTGDQAHQRIDKYWKKFIINNQGVRCVSDQPWVTIAETSELCLTLSAMGNDHMAGIIFDWIQERTFDDETYWCGYTHPDIVVWPEEKMTWTNAVVLMAADAIFNLTPAGKLFNHTFWKESVYADCIAMDPN